MSFDQVMNAFAPFKSLKQNLFCLFFEVQQEEEYANFREKKNYFAASTPRADKFSDYFEWTQININWTNFAPQTDATTFAVFAFRNQCNSAKKDGLRPPLVCCVVYVANSVSVVIYILQRFCMLFLHQFSRVLLYCL